MLTKFVPVARALNVAARQQVVRCMGGHAPANWKSDKELSIEQKSHMDFLPVPEGSWQENYNRRNAKFNIQLGAAVVAFAVTVVAMKQFNCFYLHDIPPLKNKD